MPRTSFGEDAGAYQRIDVAAAATGWVVSESGRLMGSFEDIESAYKKALSICDGLFEKGVRACVRQTDALGA